jgi:hypothetical protein
MLEVPVLFIIFRRPELTRRVFEEIRRARPRQLLVAADGPRHPEDAEACARARAIVDEVDWACDVRTRFSDRNQGCKVGVSSAITWAFESVEEAIILEDDCLPSPSFFPYCRELLERYRDDERIMAISGDRFQPGPSQGGTSYEFSVFPFIWGWATWRRAWRHYDVAIGRWQELRATSWLADWLRHEDGAAYFADLFDRVVHGRIDSWDHQWTFACWAQHALAAVPAVNLVTNIGFGEGATHTGEEGHPSSCLPTFELSTPLTHPWGVWRNEAADRFTFDHYFLPRRPGSLQLWFARALKAIDPKWVLSRLRGSSSSV